MGVLTRHGYEAWGYKAEAKPKLWRDHEAEAKSEAEGMQNISGFITKSILSECAIRVEYPTIV